MTSASFKATIYTRMYVHKVVCNHHGQLERCSLGSTRMTVRRGEVHCLHGGSVSQILCRICMRIWSLVSRKTAKAYCRSREISKYIQVRASRSRRVCG